MRFGLFCLLIGIATALSAQNIDQAVLCKNVQDGKAIEATNVFFEHETAYLVVRLSKLPKKQTYFVEWFADDASQLIETYPRTGSEMTIQAGLELKLAGSWRVDLRDNKGAVLRSILFTVKKDNRPKAMRAAGIEKDALNTIFGDLTKLPPKKKQRITLKDLQNAEPKSDGDDTTENVAADEANFTEVEKKAFLAEVNTWIGTPYVFGMAVKQRGCDCSGFASSVYQNACKLELARNAGVIFNDGQGKVIKDIKDLQFGDLVFFAWDKSGRIAHVAIYLGANHLVQALSTGHKLAITDFWPSFQQAFVGGKRYVRFVGDEK